MYCPNVGQKDFWENLKNRLATYAGKEMIVLGDFNAVVNKIWIDLN